MGDRTAKDSLYEGLAEVAKAEAAVEDARRVADRLGIAHYTLNLRETFSRSVVADFVRECSTRQAHPIDPVMVKSKDAPVHEIVHTGNASNVLRAVCRGGRLELHLNGRQALWVKCESMDTPITSTPRFLNSSYR